MVALLNLLVVGYCVSIVLSFISMCVYIFSLFACKTKFFYFIHNESKMYENTWN